MNKISQIFAHLKSRREKAFIPYITAGDPSLDITKWLVVEMEQRGVQIVELGVPFSDPLADGPTIQQASQRALQSGVTLTKILSTVKEIRKQSQLAIVLMTYYNPIYRFGVTDFVERAAEAGVDGIIVPDLPPEEAGEIKEAAQRSQLDTIFLLAPTSTPERIKLVARASTGFIYCVSVTGVTGARGRVSQEIRRLVLKVRQYTDKPLGVGFGISTPEQVKEIADFADAVIVGSAIIKVVQEYLNSPRLVPAVGEFVEGLIKGMVLPGDENSKK